MRQCWHTRMYAWMGVRESAINSACERVVRACRASVNDWLQCKMIGTAEINSKAGNGLHNSSCYR